MAGVSAGTVDRVLHNRGDVSVSSREKVQKVLDDIDYHPNMFAIGLAAKKRYHIVCIIPYYIEHDYWHAVAAGIDRAAQELRPFNVEVSYLYYRHADKSSYKEACAVLREENADAVLVAPNFREETIKLTTYLEEADIPYAFIDFNIEQTHALCYIGQDSKTSGYIAAKILMRSYEKGQELVLFLSNQKNNPAEIQMQRRLEGFMQYLSEEHKDLTIHDIVLHKEDTDGNRRILDAFFKEHPQAVLGAVFNSRVYQVASYLHEKGWKLAGLVGYDLFLRAFVDWIIYNMNQKTDFNSNVVVVQPIDKGMVDMLNAQDDLYHVNLQGLDKGETINSLTMIDVISRALNPYTQNDEFMKLAEQPEMRFVISNTTEAGIAFDPACKLTDTPASSYPGKLTQLLYHRFKTFNGDKSKGLIIFPCELIFLNGHKLKETIYQYIELWQLGDEFRAWFEEACGVYATLVDRIVPGFPRKDIAAIKEKIQYDDNLVVQAEIFHLWVIEAPQEVAEEFGQYIHKVMFDELMETLNLPKNELKKFAEDVLERFNNPFVDHAVTSIMLNSFPKYQTRDLPGLKTYLKRKGELPKGLVLGLAAIITYYKGGTRADGTEIIPNDAPEIMQLLKDLWATGDTRKVAEGVLAAKDLIWGEHGDLNTVPGLTDMITCFLKSIQEKGMQETVKGIL